VRADRLGGPAHLAGGHAGDLPPRGRPPGAQLRFTDHDGHRFQVFLTDQPDRDLACLELRHRQHARVEDRIRAAKATGLANPCRSTADSGATAAGGGVQRADRGDLIPSGSCHLSLP
jgi:hypothetical protein